MHQGTGVTLDVNQNQYFAGDTNSTDLQVTYTPLERRTTAAMTHL